MNIEEHLRTLVSFKTITADRRENARALSWVEEKLSSLSLHTSRFSHDNCSSLIITSQQTKTPRLWLAAHVDVVPGSEKLFTPWKHDSRLYGRGVYDMKYAIACYIELLTELGSNVSNYDLGIMLTSDEEYGGVNGTKALLDAGYRGDVVVLPDGCGCAPWGIEIAAKGIWHIAVRASGVAVHGSQPWRGSNAIETLINFLHDLNEHFLPKQEQRKDFFHRTLNVGTIRGGTAMNAVPDYAEAEIDIRFTSEQDFATIQNIVETLQHKHPAIIIEERARGASRVASIKDPLIETFMHIVKDVTDHDPQQTCAHGASDARFFAEYNIPTIVTAPTGGGHHSEDEWIDIEDLNRFYQILKRYVATVAKIS